METYYQTEGFRQYMVLKGSGDSIDDFQLNMLMRYAGRGLLPLEIQGCDGRFQIAYDAGADLLFCRTAGIPVLFSVGESGRFSRVIRPAGRVLHEAYRASGFSGCYVYL